MTEQRSGAAAIYDLGYRPYEGERLGRAQAARTLCFYSLRSIFGIGRSVLSKAFPIGLAVLALIPALVQLAIAAISPIEFEVVAPQDYFGFVQIVIVLFCAVAAPEVIGADQRTRTLPLYFSRALTRADYVSAKVVALVLALFAVIALPQVVLLLGNAVAADDLTGYLQDEADLVPPILASSAVVALLMGSVSLAIAGQTPRRAYATGATLAYFVIFTAIGNILAETITGEAQRYAILLSPIGVLEGAVFWLFDAPLPADSATGRSGLEGGYYLLAAAGYTLVALGLLYRRFLRLAV